MAFTVSAATNEDIRQIVHIMFKAYGGGNEYINAIFPRGLTEEGEDLTTQRMLRINSIAPGITWEKATDTTTGVVVGGAMWSLYEHVKPQRFPIDGPPGTWETAEEKEYAKALQASCVGDEMALCDGSDLPIMRMPIMAVDPFCQSKGAGTALLESGLRKADGLHAVVGLTCFLVRDSRV
ncbi:hypothetical protein CC80DRAFT_493842 [Byssothecium circinans]|uniref:N-acetyltransferase domain-containing protein n=1 Tax=Byssothecium circinans TaxID=147558 RepID=A0A6A5TN92_9PLEO|nr:hypothetical protein CC80DRAFT_493842 [Byssothecium circinans]